MQAAPLPLLDEHTVTVVAPVDDVWPALLETVDRTFARRGASTCARIVGCADATGSGPRPLAEGATVPGFRVTAADAGRALALEGRHRFSTYALTFRLEALGADGTTLRAETRAVFPGIAGRTYHLIVVRTGGHVAAVRRLLSAVRQRSERGARIDRPAE